MPYSRAAIITFLDGNGGLSPDQGLPPVQGGSIGNQLPVYPSQGLPPNNQVGNQLPPGVVQLPVFPFDPTKPDNSLPDSGNRPDNSLPRPGMKYVVKYLACVGMILVPDNSLPSNGNNPDNSLPDFAQPK